MERLKNLLLDAGITAGVRNPCSTLLRVLRSTALALTIVRCCATADLPKAIVVHEVLGAAMAIGFWTVRLP